MSRPARIQFPGGLYHVTARGNARQPIFADTVDYERFLSLLESVVSRYSVLCHAYCLMGNHYHLLLETPEANLSPAVQLLNGVYARRYNGRHGRSGHLLGGRFHAQIVDKEPHLLEVSRYIVLNPARAGLVTHPRHWTWSSYRATAGEAPKPSFLTVDWLLALGDTRDQIEAERRYRHFVNAGLGEALRSAELARLATSPLGDSAGLGSEEAARVGGTRRLIGAPLGAPTPVRPRLEELFAGVSVRAERDAGVAHAVQTHGYTQRAVADFLGLHYTTVCRALMRAEAMTKRANAPLA